MKHSFLILLIAVLFASCKRDDLTPDANGDGERNGYGSQYAGFVYTSTNSTSGNAIIAMGRKNNGKLTELPGSPYPTGSAGDAAEGDFDTQWAIRIVGDYLLAVNAGANPVNSTISVFKINQQDGSLMQIDQNPSTSAMDNIDSRGVRAASLTLTEQGGTTWVVVGNQFANPHYEGDAGTPVGMVVNTPLRNLAVFTFMDGVLSFHSIGATYEDGSHGGPTTAIFNDAGSKLAVSTWGVTHILTANPDLALQSPGRLYVYDFSNGMLTQTGMYEEEGVSGNIGISWSPSNAYIYMTNFNLHASKADHSVTVHEANTAAKVQNFETAGDNDEACWTHVSLDQTTLYTASFGNNIVSFFHIGSNDLLSVTANPNYVVRSGVPPADTKDMYEAGGKLYVSGAFMSHSVSIFEILSGGALMELPQSPYYVPSVAGTTPAQVAFLGLTGFEKG
ncbi:MAG TPA: hypothetical protein VEY71_07475 [Chitinophagales bacterium]|nr:hypothetical protein [Chitinophagales bacterium]